MNKSQRDRSGGAKERERTGFSLFLQLKVAVFQGRYGCFDCNVKGLACDTGIGEESRTRIIFVL